MTEKRKTQRELFARLSEVVSTSDVPDKNELCEFIAGRVAQLEKKAGTKGTPTKAQLANLAVKADIVRVLQETGEPMRATAIATALGLPAQKVTALLTQLVKSGTVVRIVQGKVALFAA